MPAPKGPTHARIPSEDELQRITQRAVAEIIPEAEFVAALRSGRRLRLKMGFDPSAPDLTLGHAVGLRKLRQLQELGHQVVVIVGDWTAQIGDPSGQSQTRPMLTAEEVKANAETYLRQFFKIVDRERTEIRWQSEWFNGFSLAELVRLAAQFTVAQMLQRDDFAQRYQAQKPIGVHEFLYPLLQAYDSVAVRADVEFGGTDQKFNILVGRELQPHFGQPPQCVFLVPLLVGTDGKVKMSKSLGNYIALEDPPHDMYGKVMSIPDTVMLDYFELLTDVPGEELADIRRSLEKRSVNPMEVKMRLAREIVGQFHSAEAAERAEKGFDMTYRFDFEIVPLPEGTVPVPVSFGGKPQKPKLENLPRLLFQHGLAGSVSEGRRLIEQGAVEHIGRLTNSLELYSRFGEPRSLRKVHVGLVDGMIIRVGKHRFLRIVDADKQTQPGNG